MNVEMIIPNRTWRKLTGKNVVKKQCKNATCLLLSHCTWKLCDVLLCDVLNEQLHRANKRITIAYPSSEQASFAKDNHMTFCLHSLNNIIFLYKMHISVLFVHLHFACIFFTTSIQGVTKPKRIPPANTLIPPWTPPQSEHSTRNGHNTPGADANREKEGRLLVAACRARSMKP